MRMMMTRIITGRTSSNSFALVAASRNIKKGTPSLATTTTTTTTRSILPSFTSNTNALNGVQRSVRYSIVPSFQGLVDCYSQSQQYRHNHSQQQSRSFVWHAGFMNDKEAQQISKQIRILQTEQELRSTHPELTACTPTELQHYSSQVAALHGEHLLVTGEIFTEEEEEDDDEVDLDDDKSDNDDTTKSDSDSDSDSDNDTISRLSDLDVLEIELRLLEQELERITPSTIATTGAANEQQRVHSLKAIMAALHEEYETMVHRHGTAEDLD